MDNTDILVTEIDDIDTIKSEVLKNQELAFDNRLDEADTIALNLFREFVPDSDVVYIEKER